MRFLSRLPAFIFVWMLFCLPAKAEVDLTRLVRKIQPAVVMIITYDVDGEVNGIGSGFFIDREGHLVTNYHVLKHAYTAEAKMHDGRKFPVENIVALDESADLMKVTVAVTDGSTDFVKLSKRLPTIAEKVVVVGSPLGLEQTVSEGIVSAIRQMPNIGDFFQMSAPISPGSSGGPVVDMQGQVIGVATFQTTIGQNLNFAVSSRSIQGLKNESRILTLPEWTYARSLDKPRVAAELCRKGFQFSIQGENKKALEYYLEAAQQDPTDTTAWSGLGYCYVGLNRQDEALAAHKRAIENNPASAEAHYNLAIYYEQVGLNQEAVEAFREALRINPAYANAYFHLGIAYLRLGRLEEGSGAFRQVTRLEPASAPAYFFIGVTSAALGRYEEALEAHRAVLERSPDHVPSIYNMGLIYEKMGRYDEELAAYKKAIRINPDYAPAHFRIGKRFLENGNKSGALEEFKILKQLDPDMANRLFDLIYG